MDNPWFLRQVRTALNSLYDPSVLRNSPLVSLLGLEQRGDVVAALRRALTDAIESLQPAASTPRDSKTWRVYQILRRRYIEQLNQREVASDLGLSTRQLQREEHLARQVLADHLWTAHHLDTKQHLIPSTTDQDQAPLEEDEHVPTRAQELEWLRESVPIQTVDVGDVLRDVLGILDPLLKSSRVKVEYLPQANVPRVSLQVPILRQALLDVIGEAVRCAPGGQIRIVVEAQGQGVGVQVQVPGITQSLSEKQVQDRFAQQSATGLLREASGNTGALLQSAESLEMTRELVQLCGGTLEIEAAATAENVFAAKMTLPATEQVTVLVIDDNGDALQLAQRYLSNSRYRFIGTQDAEHGLALAQDLSPHAILLDVMMPERDGWTVLGQLREHPKTHHIPVIICSILAQEQLALTLGAAQFLRKPVTRQALLSALDRQLGLSQKPC